MTGIVVTGSSGRLGGRVARRLAAAGTAQTLLVRDPARAPQLSDTTVRVAEYSDTAAVEQALAGADVVLMVSGAEAPDRLDHHRSFVDAAAAAGVGHVVYTSFFAAAPDATFTLARDHWITEQYIREADVPFTFLRDNIYADFLPFMVGDDGVLRGPGSDGRVSMVAQDDIADVAVAVLGDPGQHVGATYDLTGPQALTFAEAVEIVGSVTGESLSYYPETVEEAYASRAKYGAPKWQVDAWVSTYTAVAAGELAPVSDDVPRLTGHPATSLRELLSRSAAG
jgi:NAD(P)H dehydrogenase (quinone)